MIVELFNINIFMLYMGAFLAFRHIERKEYAKYTALVSKNRDVDKDSSTLDRVIRRTEAYGDWKRATGLLQCSMMFLGIESMGLGIYGVWSLAVYLWGVA